MYQKQFQTFAHSEQDTQSFANRLKSSIPFGTSVGLVGELGAGKTTLVRHFLALFGQTDCVSSPTYVLQHIYKIDQFRCIEHWDLYRLLAVPQELEMPAGEHVLRLIEWADKFSDLHCDYLIKIDLLEDGSRVLQLLSYSDDQRK